MTSFRLARLLKLRERQARIEQLAWAAKERAAVEAATRRDAVGRTIEAGYAATRAIHDAPAAGSERTPDASSEARAQVTLLAYERIDALHQRAHQETAALAEARREAQDARAPYDERRIAVEALRRLEDKWERGERRASRRRETRSQDATIAARAIRAAADDAADRSHPTTTR